MTTRYIIITSVQNVWQSTYTSGSGNLLKHVNTFRKKRSCLRARETRVAFKHVSIRHVARSILIIRFDMSLSVSICGLQREKNIIYIRPVRVLWRDNIKRRGKIKTVRVENNNNNVYTRIHWLLWEGSRGVVSEREK